MRLLGYGLSGVLLLACSEDGELVQPSAGGASDSGASDASAGSGGGGIGGAGGSGGGSIDAGGADGSTEPLVDPDLNEACTEDPEPASWSEESVSFASLGATSVFAGAAIGGGVTLLGARILTSDLGTDSTGAVYVSVAAQGGAWSEPTKLSETPDFLDRPLVRVASDGSGGIVLWVEADQTVRYATWSANAGWTDSRLLSGGSGPVFSAIDAVSLPGGQHVLALGGGLRIIASDGTQSAEVPLPDGLNRNMFLGAGDVAVIYVTSVLTAAGTSRYEYTPALGFGAPETAPLTTAQATSWQEFWFEATTGIGARLIRVSGAQGGLYVTVRRGPGSYSAEENITTATGNASSAPTVTASGDELVVLWPEGGRIVERAHDAAWSAQRPLARSTNVELSAIAGSATGAGLVGTITLDSQTVAKLFRRGPDATWYCARLVRQGLNPTVTSDPSGELLFIGDEAGDVRLVRFRP